MSAAAGQSQKKKVFPFPPFCSSRSPTHFFEMHTISLYIYLKKTSEKETSSAMKLFINFYLLNPIIYLCFPPNFDISDYLNAWPGTPLLPNFSTLLYDVILDLIF